MVAGARPALKMAGNSVVLQKDSQLHRMDTEAQSVNISACHQAGAAISGFLCFGENQPYVQLKVRT